MFLMLFECWKDVFGFQRCSKIRSNHPTPRFEKIRVFRNLKSSINWKLELISTRFHNLWQVGSLYSQVAEIQVKLKSRFHFRYVEVSWNRGTPKSSILVVSIINHPFGDTPTYGNPHIVGINHTSPQINCINHSQIDSRRFTIFFYPHYRGRYVVMMVHKPLWIGF